MLAASATVLWDRMIDLPTDRIALRKSFNCPISASVADFIAEKFAATDALIGQLNDLRKAILSVGKSIILSQSTVALAASIYSAFASYIPSWLPVHEIQFGPIQPVLIIVAGVALGAAELALLVALFLCMLWL